MRSEKRILMNSYEGLEKLFPVHMDVDYIRVYRKCIPLF